MTTKLDPRDETRSGSVGVALRTRIELWLAAVLMALSFAAGFTIRALSDPPAPQGTQGSVADLAPAPLPPIFAPPLTDDQLQQGLPSDHPDLPTEDGTTEGAGGGTDDAGSDEALE